MSSLNMGFLERNSSWNSKGINEAEDVYSLASDLWSKGTEGSSSGLKIVHRTLASFFYKNHFFLQFIKKIHYRNFKITADYYTYRYI